MISRFQFGGTAQERGWWTALLLLLLAVLVPTAVLLYFISIGINNERDLARQKLGEAYRGQLRLVRDRIDSFWEERARQLDSRTDADEPGQYFEHCFRDGLADSVIVLNADGSPAYPSLPPAPRADPALSKKAWNDARGLEDSGNFAEAAKRYEAIVQGETDTPSAARAMQASIRCLVRNGQREAALRAIDRHFNELGPTLATDLDGHAIGADERMLELEMLSPDDPRFQPRAEQLHHLLQNYEHSMPAAQRLFLMDRMRALFRHGEYHAFLTYQAERLAERVLSAGKAVRGDTALRQSGIADTWSMTTPSGRVIALYYEVSKLTRSMSQLLVRRAAMSDPAFAITPPGGTLPPHDDWVPAGPHLPGWKISMRVDSPGAADGSTERRIAAYVWLGFLTVAAVAVLALLAGGFLRRQMRIASLKTDLVAAVSHELKTPLASMKLLVESLLSGETIDPQRTRQYLQLIARENGRLSRLIDNFLTFSRMERNRGKFEFARVEPAAVAQAAMDSVGDRFPVSLSVADHLPPIYADQDALVTVLLNLLDNAYKYSEGERKIGLAVAKAGGRVSFCVSDNGIGISEREQKKIFRRFYQVNRRLASGTGGVGLGLSIVEFIVKAHGGMVSVESRPGAGSTFTVLLPPSASAAGAAA